MAAEREFSLGEDVNWSWGKVAAVGVGVCVVAAGAWLATRVRVCQPHEFLVRTGWLIDDMAISKKGVVLPFQRGKMVDMTPRTYSFDLHNMSREKVEFSLPVVFTIGPVNPRVDLEGFKRYALQVDDTTTTELVELIRGVVEGEARGLTANLTVEEMFNSKDRFRDNVVTSIQRDLDQMGLSVLNANIREMSDFDESNKYFAYRKQRAIEMANNEARIEVAEAEKLGRVGTMERERDQRIQVAAMEAEARIQENERDQRIATSNAQLARVREEARLTEQLASIETDNLSRERAEQMQAEVEKLRAARELESKRADILTQAKIAAEAAIAEAEGEAAAVRLSADAAYYAETQRAAGIEAVMRAQAEGLRSIADGCENSDLVRFYLGLENDLFVKMAREQAGAIQGLKPNMTIWNTGGAESGTDAMTPIIKMVQSAVPLVQGLGSSSGDGKPFWQQSTDTSASSSK